MTAPHLAPGRADRRSRGFEIVLIAVYGLFALSATARSLVQVLRDFSYAPVAYGFSLLAAATYIAVTVALIRRERRKQAPRKEERSEREKREEDRL